MKENFEAEIAAIRQSFSRRSFLRGLGGGALAMSAGQLLAGCGGSSGGAGGAVNNRAVHFVHQHVFGAFGNALRFGVQ